MTLSQINPNQLRPPGGPELERIVQVGSDRRAQAIEKLVQTGLGGDGAHAQRFLEYARSHRINLDCMWARLTKQGQIESTVLVVPSPGRTAMVFSSHPVGSHQVGPFGQLIDHACRHLAELNVNLAQALLEPAGMVDRQMFEAGGFVQLTTLNYMERPLKPGQAHQNVQVEWPADAQTFSYAENQRDAFLHALDRSYEQTLDCPGLRGCRKTRDILEGHRASGAFDPRLWTLLEIGGEPAGVLLLNPSSDQQSVELAYLGLAKPWRGRGLGTQLLRHGLTLLGGRRERVMNLAVDESNAPAIALYRREGFRTVLRRLAMIRPLEEREFRPL
ncbi:MAG: GNAT family N-acetyltransferase [Phycisphaerales bacterium]|nr:GNAT family N-acetyltransferase [Phycisphaerales bacterium]MCI0630969.1 GNAT family N-acetyltransferase [Phycisphaerales bacterium]MCI0674332.1 GNAT family N-acetyltransferase [Phycisphaerales bacterium]